MENLNKTDWASAKDTDGDAVVIDVRTAAEVEEGMIEGALHLDIYDAQNFMAEIEKMDKSKSYYMYCRSGGRSGQACMLMDSLGFEKTYNLEGGYMGWLE